MCLGASPSSVSAEAVGETQPKIESCPRPCRPYRVSGPAQAQIRPERRGMDTSLVMRAQHGDEEAFASLAVAVGDRLHAVAHRILRDIDLAEVATQQALLAIWRDLPQVRDPARFDAWSYRPGIAASLRWSPTECGCYGGLRPAPVGPDRLKGTNEGTERSRTDDLVRRVLLTRRLGASDSRPPGSSRPGRSPGSWLPSFHAASRAHRPVLEHQEPCPAVEAEQADERHQPGDGDRRVLAAE